jgi:hypothetical protein
MGIDAYDAVNAKVHFDGGASVSFDLSWILPDGFEAIVNQGIYFTGMDPNIGSVIIGGLLLLAVMMNDKFRALAMSYITGKKK